ncbi:nucleotidyltransferase domain-containing protein [Kosmotoga pacifica]|uniref:Polymerase nucleotidyl transferase domain-containing protein n=1 Tax=Kosmotoga pacifica TaxID=1330330 RepID=A0A0G2Z7U7_9BACT|nr:nucleotidyltransferase domain-containing protein [Kosmotoga pacifica]AKI97675.1 hypothetical protein IX53_07450 [Kosmotoga pacifica]
MPDVFKIAEILVSHAVQAHKDEIAIIAYYGSYATGLASPTSDLDIFYIPDDGKAGSLSSQFVFGNLPYDFWPLSWEFAERIANARHNWAIAASLIADAKVLYYRSQKDLDRFNALKARITELMGPNGRKTMIQQALEEFKNTLFQLGQMRLAVDGNDAISMHWAGLKFVNSVANCLALVNQTYFTKAWENNLIQISKMSQKPDGFEDMIKEIITQKDTKRALEVADRLAKEVRKILLSAQFSISEPSDPKDVFKDFYFFIFEYVNKVLSACKRNDVIAAKFSAFQLQEEICQLMNKIENGFYGTNFNMLNEYSEAYEKAGFPDLLKPASKGDLVELARQAQQLDKKAREWLENHSIELNILRNEEELRQFLTQRDPM